MNGLETIRCVVYKYPNILHYEWEASLIENNENYVLAYGSPNRKFIHHTKNFTMLVKEPEVLYFPLNNWYSVSIQKCESGGGYKYYCNICEPSRYENNILSFVDYDIDVINNGIEWKTIDWDDFNNNSIKYDYPSQTINIILEKEKELRNIIIKKQFPFNGFLLNHADVCFNK